MVSNAIFPVLQSSYRQFHSTETALIKVMNDILLKMNSQHVTLLILLDLSAAFETVDHQKLLERLSDEVGIRGTAMNCFRSSLSDRSQRVYVHVYMFMYMCPSCIRSWQIIVLMLVVSRIIRSCI